MKAPRQAHLGDQQSASNRTPRQINRNLILHQIRIRQPVSRADLARVCGLQRSTVSLIVEELLGGHWIIEGPAKHATRGRKPTSLYLNSERKVLALDVHPARTTIAVADLAGFIWDESEIVLPPEPGKVLNAIVTAIRRTIGTHRTSTFEGIGITVPGRFSHQREKTIFAPNVPWPISQIKSKAEQAIGLPVFVDNVANACALSEVWFGYADPARDLVVVNVSEGIGTGIYANGRLLCGNADGAGEFGHVQMNPEGRPCGCGSWGCWETMASNRAAMRYYSEITGRSLSAFDALIDLVKTKDASALAAMEKMCKALGRGMHMIVAALAPAEIVVVGELVRVWSMAYPLINTELHAFPLIGFPRIRTTREPDKARLRSAVALVMAGKSV
jgi:predicted NBD/HSP70 family sugar kinase